VIVSARASHGNDTCDAQRTYSCLDSPATPVRQVFLNLIGNGIKFSHSGGTVTAKMKLQQHDHSDKYRMDGSIQDEGVGMTPVEVGRLFQRFA
jgi:two-component system sensor histidine kinase/response regulator